MYTHVFLIIILVNLFSQFGLTTHFDSSNQINSTLQFDGTRFNPTPQQADGLPLLHRSANGGISPLDSIAELDGITELN